MPWAALEHPHPAHPAVVSGQGLILSLHPQDNLQTKAVRPTWA